MAVRKPNALLDAFQVMVAAAYLVITVIVLSSPRPSAARFPALLTACALAAVVFRQGWLIPCTLLGPIITMLTLGTFRDGPIQLELNAACIGIGAVGGLVIGLVIDVYSRIKRQILAQRNMPLHDSGSGGEDHPRA